MVKLLGTGPSCWKKPNVFTESAVVALLGESRQRSSRKSLVDRQAGQSVLPRSYVLCCRLVGGRRMAHPGGRTVKCLPCPLGRQSVFVGAGRHWSAEDRYEQESLRRESTLQRHSR